MKAKNLSKLLGLAALALISSNAHIEKCYSMTASCELNGESWDHNHSSEYIGKQNLMGWMNWVWGGKWHRKNSSISFKDVHSKHPQETKSRIIVEKEEKLKNRPFVLYTRKLSEILRTTTPAINNIKVKDEFLRQLVNVWFIENLPAKNDQTV